VRSRRKLVSKCVFASLLVVAAFALAALGTSSAKGKSSRNVADPQPWFTDIAGNSNFSYITNNGFTGRKYFPQPMCGGIAAFDFDNDGFMDLFFTNGAKMPELKKTDASFHNCLLRNRGDGTFEDVTAKAGLAGEGIGFNFGVAAGDYDNDGNEDLFICSTGRNTLYHNNGDGTFTDVTPGSGLDQKPENLLSVAAAWVDYDNDGLLDLVVSNYTIWHPTTDKRCSADSKAESYCSPKVYVSVPTRLYHNLGGGKFKDVTESSGLGAALSKGMGISIADFDGDGWMDIFIANDTERNLLFLNQRNGTFKEVGLPYGVAFNNSGSIVSGMGSDAKDYNNDGWVDIAYNDLVAQNFGLFRNEGGASFDYASVETRIARLSYNFSGWSMGFIDYDNDGWKDFFSANGDVDNLRPDAKEHDTMFRNLGGKTFEDVSEQMGPDFMPLGYHRGSAFVDINNDGFMDLVITGLGEKPRILRNNALSHNHWLLLDLRGHTSNRDAIGAKIKVTTASGRTLYNHVTTSVGFMSSSDRRVHFGLGDETSVSSVQIQWPSGIVQKLDNVKVDQILKVEEPAKSASNRTAVPTSVSNR
jgi:enediyne biosynthesis protein E4